MTTSVSSVESRCWNENGHDLNGATNGKSPTKGYLVLKNLSAIDLKLQHDTRKSSISHGHHFSNDLMVNFINGGPIFQLSRQSHIVG